jgi:predicted PolB exonuclease-like 3'-5' exonuclease
MAIYPGDYLLICNGLFEVSHSPDFSLLQTQPTLENKLHQEINYWQKQSRQKRAQSSGLPGPLAIFIAG